MPRADRFDGRHGAGSVTGSAPWGRRNRAAALGSRADHIDEVLDQGSLGLPEPLDGLTKGQLRVNAQPAREGDGLHQRLAHLALGGVAAGRVGCRAAGLLAAGRALGIGPAERLARVEQRRQRLGKRPMRLGAALDVTLDPLPLGQDLARRLQRVSP